MAAAGDDVTSFFKAFGDVFEPEEAIAPILTRSNRDAFENWVQEIFEEEALAEVGITARRKAMFTGQPGIGKTTLAHFLCARLGMYMLAIRPDMVLSRWVNASVENIGGLFKSVDDYNQDSGTETPIVIFMDEFDAIGNKRMDAETFAAQQQNQIVNTLLQRIEQHNGFVIAATNFRDKIDAAIWRRFQIHIDIDMPERPERELIIARYLHPFGLPADELTALAEATAIASPALIREFCEGIKRSIVLAPRLGWDEGKAATIDRVLAQHEPHFEKPRLWSNGSTDHAVNVMSWPLQRANKIKPKKRKKPASAGNVITLQTKKT